MSSVSAVAATLKARLPSITRTVRAPSRRRVAAWQDLRRFEDEAPYVEELSQHAAGLTSLAAMREAGTVAPLELAGRWSPALAELVGWLALAVTWGWSGIAGRLVDWADLLGVSKRSVQRALDAAEVLELVEVRQRYAREQLADGAARWNQISSLYLPGPALLALLPSSCCPPADSGSLYPTPPESFRVDKGVAPGGNRGVGSSGGAVADAADAGGAAAADRRSRGGGYANLRELSRGLAAQTTALEGEGRDRRAEGAGELVSADELRAWARELGGRIEGMVRAASPAVLDSPPEPPGGGVTC